MSASNHTPGPWKLDARMSTQGFWRVLGLLEDGTHEYHVANVIDANDSAQNDTNARLIAAAPDLLVALKLIVADLPANRDWLDPAVERMAHELIAKVSP